MAHVTVVPTHKIPNSYLLSWQKEVKCAFLVPALIDIHCGYDEGKLLFSRRFLDHDRPECWFVLRLTPYKHLDLQW